MNPFLTLKTAVASVWANKLRAGLTLLGIVIGVAAVVALMAIGRGAQATVTAGIEGLGTDLLFVRPGAATEGSFVFGLGSAETLTLEDAVALQDPVFAPDVLAVAPQTQNGVQAVAGSENAFTTALGVTSSYIGVRNFDLTSGRNISPADVTNQLQVVVLGSRIGETLFGAADPVGRNLRLNGRLFAVVGVLQSRGGTGFANQDDQVLVPITTAHFRLDGSRTPQGGITVSSINVQGRDGALKGAQAEIESVLRLRHRIAPGDEDDFTVTSQQDTIDTLESTTDTFVIFLAAVAGISLVVGGIGIMNIMLVSVTERTREIGIRRAVGAKRRDILLQFVSEATLLSAAGGAIGILLGSAIARAMDGRTFGSETFQTTLSGDVAVYALAVSAGIGLFFGIFPAARAARLDPIEALRQA